MTKPIPEEMLQATRLTRAGRLTEATAFIQRLLGGKASPAPPAEPARDTLAPPTIELTAEDATISTTPHAPAGAPIKSKHQPAPDQSPARTARTARIFDGLHVSSLNKRRHLAPGMLAPAAGQFITCSVTSHAGSRDYRLYVPSIAEHATGEPRPLIVMLHGCTQSADDFAAGTRMNFAAEIEGCYVAYPEQIAAANASKCWNWFERAHQSRDAGEPSLIAGITRQIMSDHAIDPRRIYIAGLSAGGAAAAVVADVYPDLFAAAGVHSGLACGVARDMPSAFAAMQGRHGAYTSPRTTPIPTIVFHGDADKTVHPRNGADVIIGATAGRQYRLEVERGTVPGGRSFTRSIQRDESGHGLIEDWVIHGGGHAWSGGSVNGSYTDPAGPDATTHMLRFFLSHNRRI